MRRVYDRALDNMRLMTLTFLLLTWMIVGCASHQQRNLPSQGSAIQGVYPGNLVVITTLDGKHYEFHVQEVTANGLAGETLFIAYQDMASVQLVTKPRSTAWKKWVWGAVIVAAAIAVASFQKKDEPEQQGWGWTCDDFSWLYVCPD